MRILITGYLGYIGDPLVRLRAQGHRAAGRDMKMVPESEREPAAVPDLGPRLDFRGWSLGRPRDRVCLMPLVAIASHPMPKIPEEQMRPVNLEGAVEFVPKPKQAGISAFLFPRNWRQPRSGADRCRCATLAVAAEAR